MLAHVALKVMNNYCPLLRQYNQILICLELVFGKPRTRPNSFEGIGEQALEWLQVVKQETDLRVATEVANAQHVEKCLQADIDVLWLGARTTVNPFYVQEIAEALKGVDIPVLVKNPLHPELSLWIGALERLNKAGINQLAAIHRGFFTLEQSAFRNEPKWEIPIRLKKEIPRTTYHLRS